MKQSGRRIAAVVLALVLAAAGMAGCRISRTRTMTDKERMACEAYTISFPEEVLGDKTLAETILSLCTAQEETAQMTGGDYNRNIKLHMTEAKRKREVDEIGKAQTAGE